MTPVQTRAVVAEALAWVGTPYVHMGRLRGVGVDCAQLLIAVYAAAGVVAEFDVGTYTQDWYLHRSEELYLGWIQRHAEQVAEAEPGDIAVFSFGRTASHGGIVTAPGYMVHAYRPHGAVDLIELRALDARFHSFWRVNV